jgi:1-acyl-sn-glycerol-3-phosphate acyltransferase
MSPWPRRALTIPGYVLVWLLVLVSLPMTLPLAALVDLLRGNRLATVRAIVMAAVFLTCEMIGIVLSLAIWLLTFFGRGDRFQRWNFDLQQWWAGALFRCARRIYQLRVEINSTADLRHGPYIVFIRHTSLADTLLPSAVFSQPHGIVLRYVLKRELLWDPCLDIVGNRLPNAFVERGTGNIAGGVGAVSRLMANLGERDGVLIYPEGTRFTRAKQARVLAQLKKKEKHMYDKAARLRHVLPPRLGGPLVLLEQNERADVVFCAHTGLEHASRACDLLNGSLVGATVRVFCWRVALHDIPPERDARIEWLYEHWTRLDDWVDSRMENK